jgi:hypothetical protein
MPVFDVINNSTNITANSTCSFTTQYGKHCVTSLQTDLLGCAGGAVVLGAFLIYIGSCTRQHGPFKLGLVIGGAALVTLVGGAITILLGTSDVVTEVAAFVPGTFSSVMLGCRIYAPGVMTTVVSNCARSVLSYSPLRLFRRSAPVAAALPAPQAPLHAGAP